MLCCVVGFSFLNFLLWRSLSVSYLPSIRPVYPTAASYQGHQAGTTLLYRANATSLAISAKVIQASATPVPELRLKGLLCVHVVMKAHLLLALSRQE